MTLNPTLEKGLSRSRIPGSPFKPLPDGYSWIAEYQAQCELCGDECWHRYSISPSRLAGGEQTPCSCDKQQDQGYNRSDYLRAEVESIFGPWDMTRDFRYSLDTSLPETEEDVKLVRNLGVYVKRFEPGAKGICFYGLPGRGKTHYALCTVQAVRKKDYLVLSLKSIDLLNRLKKCYSSKEVDQELQVIRLLKAVDLLLIDDIGTEKPTGWVREKLYEVIDSRHGSRTTIFTTNLGGEDLAKKLGQALASRIYGTGHSVKVAGRDRRLGSQADFCDVGTEISEFELEMKQGSK